jgi:hypothetical protein
MIDASFDSRTQANMEVALDRVCRKSPLGERHEVRKRVAEAILRPRAKASAPLAPSRRLVNTRWPVHSSL